jgi:hypothetical protein
MHGDNPRARERDVTEDLQAAPEIWIGEEITLQYTAGSQKTTNTCILRAVNDRGVVVEYKGGNIFHPWHGISALRHGAIQRDARVRPKPPGF